MNGAYQAVILIDRAACWCFELVGVAVMVMVLTVAGVTITAPPPSNPPEVINMAWDEDATTAETVAATAWLTIADFEIHDMVVCKIAHDHVTDVQLVGICGKWYIL